MQQIALVTESHPLNRALLTNSTAQPPVRPLLPTLTEPGTGPSGGAIPVPDGVYQAGQGGMFAPYRLWLQPFCQGPRGSVFFLNLWGWRSVTVGGQTPVWVPAYLAGFSCRAGDIPGPTGGVGVLESENFCDSISLVAGSLGTGEIVATGGDRAAWLTVDLRGSTKYQFDFQQLPDNDVGMNALWAWV